MKKKATYALQDALTYIQNSLDGGFKAIRDDLKGNNDESHHKAKSRWTNTYKGTGNIIYHPEPSLQLQINFSSIRENKKMGRNQIAESKKPTKSRFEFQKISLSASDANKTNLLTKSQRKKKGPLPAEPEKKSVKKGQGKAANKAVKKAAGPQLGKQQATQNSKKPKNGKQNSKSAFKTLWQKQNI